MDIDTRYVAAEGRYDDMVYKRCGSSGLKLPALSLGLWHNFGEITPLDTQRAMCRTAFDLGITHFDLANNYGPPYGEAERNFGAILARDLAPYRDELIISTKAGWDMWPGPYGDFGSRKYIISSCDQSLSRMGLEYVDIFYHHRPDPETPLEETVCALDQLVKSGKALYVGVSQYSAEDTARAAALFRELKTPFIIHQPRYNMFDRWIEDGLIDTMAQNGIGAIVFSPLAQGMLTGKYLNGIPGDSRIAKDPRFLKEGQITAEKQTQIKALASIAEARGQSLTQMALAWVLRHREVASALIGASRPEQVVENVGALKNLAFSAEELARIDEIIG